MVLPVQSGPHLKADQRMVDAHVCVRVQLKESCTDKKHELTYAYVAKFLEKRLKQLEKDQAPAAPQAQAQPQLPVAPLPPLPPPQAPQAPQQQPAQTQSAAHAPIPRPPIASASSGASGAERPRSNSSDARLGGGAGAANPEGLASLLRGQCEQLKGEKEALKTKLQVRQAPSHGTRKGGEGNCCKAQA